MAQTPRIDRRMLAASGLPAALQALILQLAAQAERPAIRGAPGRGIAHIAVHPDTGALTIALTDGTSVETVPLRGPSAYDLAVMLGYEGSLADWIETQRGVNGAALEAALQELRGPQAVRTDFATGRHGLWLDRGGQTLLALTPTGLDFRASTELLDQIAPPLAGRLGIDSAHAVGEGAGGWDLIRDRAGRSLLRLTPSGLDFAPSAELAARLRAALEQVAVDNRHLTLTVCLTQSLLFMNGDSETAPVYPDVDPQLALRLAGLRRADGVALTMAGPGSMGYDTATPASGFVPVDPAPADPTGAYYAVKGYNGFRRRFGLLPRRTVGTLWGQAGEHITRFNAILGDAPAGIADATHHWANLMFWLSEAARLAAAAGLTPRLDLLVVQGTSSKQDSDPHLHAASMRALIVALRQACDERGIDEVAVYFSQPGGDTDTSPAVEHWQVAQGYLEMAEQGYGVLVAPEAYIRIFDNNVHFGEAAGQQLMGMFNWARAAREAGRDFTIRRPRVSRAGNVVTLDYASLWDGEIWEIEPDRYAGQGIDANLGYTATGAAITGVELIGRQVRLSCSAPPSRISYMMQAQDVRPLNDGYTAWRGRLVTSSRMRDPLDPAILHRRRMPSHHVDIP